MKIAILADIHANTPALEAVLRDARRRKVEELWHLGDCVGYGPFPNETIGLLKQRKIKSVLGNYDQKVLDFRIQRHKWKKEKHPDKFFSFQWTSQQLSPESRIYLKSLRAKKFLFREEACFLLVHGSIDDMQEGVSDQTSENRLKQLAQATKANVILCGHSHSFFYKKIGRVHFVNPGSVGRPFDGDTRTSYVVLDIKKKALRVKLVRLMYPIDKVLKSMKKKNFPEILIESIRLARSVDGLEKKENEQAEKQILNECFSFAKFCHYDKTHCDQVCRLALDIFDQLQRLHGLGKRERFWLHCASILHDVGWVVSGKRHHKIACDMILKTEQIHFNEQDRIVVALLARYHRRALPCRTHNRYGSLTPETQRTVNILSSFLRVADGLDSNHASAINRVRCETLDKKIIFYLKVNKSVNDDFVMAYKKSDLLKRVFHKDFMIQLLEGE